jgi:hypothetical protein
MSGLAHVTGSGEPERWAAAIRPRLEPNSDLAFFLFVAESWNGRVGSLNRGTALGRAGHLRTMYKRLNELATQAQARSDDISVFARAHVAIVNDAIGQALGDDRLIREADNLAADAIELADARPPNLWTNYTYLEVAGLALSHNDAAKAAQLLRRCVGAHDPDLRVSYEPYLALALHVLGDPDALEVAARAREHTEPSYAVVTATCALALELAAHGDQRGARHELAAALPGLDGSVRDIKTTMLVGAAGIAIHGHEPARAARWLGAAAAEGGIFSTPAGVLLYRQYVSILREALAAEERHRERDAGRNLPLDEALNEVASWTTN